MYIQLFFFTATATTEIYTYSHTLSPHDALPSCVAVRHDIHLVPVGETELLTQFGRDRDLPFAVQFHADSCRTCYSYYMIPRWSEFRKEWNRLSRGSRRRESPGLPTHLHSVGSSLWSHRDGFRLGRDRRTASRRGTRDHRGPGHLEDRKST